MKKFNVMLRYLLVLYFSTIVLNLPLFAVDRPITTDSRIKTLVYTEQEVFRLVVHYGYQTSVEFAEDEEVQTISVGNNYAWQLSPLGRRLFIKPLEENILTNMTILTNKRTYQFEIQSKEMDGFTDEELVYVVRFFYPDAYKDVISTKASSDIVIDDKPTPQITPYNFDYKILNSSIIAPTKVFDDGINTYFQFQESFNAVPSIAMESAKELVILNPKKIKDYFVVNAVGKSFLISSQQHKVQIVNNRFQTEK